jgi:hypothetical protein
MAVPGIETELQVGRLAVWRNEWAKILVTIIGSLTGGWAAIFFGWRFPSIAVFPGAPELVTITPQLYPKLDPEELIDEIY